MCRKITDPDEAVKAFQRGEAAGFEYFFNKLFGALRYYAFRIVNDIPTAEDVVCESYEKIWNRRDTFTHPKVIKSWLYTTVRHGCLNRLQKSNLIESLDKTYNEFYCNNVRVDSEHNSEFTGNIKGLEVPSHFETIVKAEVIADCHRYINSLPFACRNIFKMLYIQGKTVREISEELHLSISTVKNQKCRGLTLIRKTFKIAI